MATLTIFIDTKANKVVFAEAGKEFLDFLAQVMALPLSSLLKLLKDKDMAGSLGALYNSMLSLPSEHYETGSKKQALVWPNNAFAAVPLLSLDVETSTIKVYTCDNKYCNEFFSDRPGVICNISSSHSTMGEEIYFAPSLLNKGLGYVKKNVSYIVMDNLEVKPMSVSLLKSFFKDYESIKEMEVLVGRDEGLAILKASFERQDVLTSVFLPSVPPKIYFARRGKIPKRE